MKILVNPTYQEYLEELERVKRDQCRQDNHNFIRDYPYQGTRPYCSRCGENA